MSEPARDAGGPAQEAAEIARERGAPLLEALAAHLSGAREHAEATAAFALAIAVELGLEPRRCELVREAARLHDVGMVYVPAGLLRRPLAELEADQRAQVEAHLEAAYRLTRGAGVPEPACEWILRTRERFDGAGPETLAGEALPVEPQVIRAACACDLLLSGGDRTQAEAVLAAAAGTELDPRVAGAAVAVLTGPAAA